MAEASRTDDTGITLRIKFKSETIDKFVERYGVDLSPGGIFIRTREPLPVGTKLTFEFTLFDGAPLMSGLGVVAWVRDPDATRTGTASGMGIRFEKLLGDSQGTLNKLLAERAKRQGAPQARYTAPLMEAVRVPTPASVQVVPQTAPFRESPSAVAPSPAAPSPAAPGVPGPTADAWGAEDKTEIAALPPSFYFKEADKALAEEAGSLAKAVPARAPTPAFGTPRPGTPAGGVPGSREGDASSSSRNGKRGGIGAETPALGIGAQGARVTPRAPMDLGGATPTPIGVPSALPRAETPFGGEGARGARATDGGLPASLSQGVPETRPLGPVTAAPPPRGPGRALLVIAIAAGVVVAGVWGAPKLLGKRQPPAATPEPPAAAVVEPVPAPAPPPVVTETPPQPAAGATGTAAAPPPETPAAPAATEPVAEKAPVPAAKEPARPVAKAKPARSARPKPALRAPREVIGDTETAPIAAETPKPAEPAAEPAPTEPAAPAPAAGAEDLYWLKIRSTPTGAEVVIDGQLEGKTPFERRIFDIGRSYSISIRRAGYEPVERTVSGGDDWVKTKGKDNVRTLQVNAKLTKTGAAPATPPPVEPPAEPATPAPPAPPPPAPTP